MQLPTRCPSCGGGLKPTVLGKLQDKHLVCPYCQHKIDVPDEFETREVETTQLPGGGYKRVERTVIRRDAGISSDAETGISKLPDDMKASVEEKLREHADEFGIDADDVEVLIESADTGDRSTAAPISKKTLISKKTVHVVEKGSQVDVDLLLSRTHNAGGQSTAVRALIHLAAAVIIIGAAIWIVSQLLF